MIFSFNHKVHFNLKYHSVCPLVLIGTPPLPLASVSPTSEPKGETHSPAEMGSAWPNSDD